AVCYASWLIGVGGVLLLHRSLIRFGAFGEPASAWTAAAIVWGTPVLYYLTLAPGFSHAVSLAVGSLLLWLPLDARDRGWTVGRAAIGGAVAGLAALVREQDLLFLAIPALLVAIDGLRAGRGGHALLHLATLVVTTALVFTPQLFAYHAINGRFAPSK